MTHQLDNELVPLAAGAIIAYYQIAAVPAALDTSADLDEAARLVAAALCQVTPVYLINAVNDERRRMASHEVEERLARKTRSALAGLRIKRGDLNRAIAKLKNADRPWSSGHPAARTKSHPEPGKQPS